MWISLSMRYFFPTRWLFPVKRSGSVFPFPNPRDQALWAISPNRAGTSSALSSFPLQWEHVLTSNFFHAPPGLTKILFPFSRELSTKVDWGLAIIFTFINRVRLLACYSWHQYPKKHFFTCFLGKINFFSLKIFSFMVILIPNHFVKEFYCI